jgi:hypothetical protein
MASVDEGTGYGGPDRKHQLHHTEGEVPSRCRQGTFTFSHIPKFTLLLPTNTLQVAWTTILDNTTASDNTTDPTQTEASVPTISTPTPPSNISLDTPYLDYVSSIPTLANALIDLGRAWHKELNAPVSEATGALEQAMEQFSTSMLEDELLSSKSILRTIRASSSLESAQVAWSRMLNLPGAAGTKKKRGKEEVKRPQLAEGQFYTHRELWGRSEGVVPRQDEDEESSSKPTDESSEAEVTRKEWRIEKIARRFIA